MGETIDNQDAIASQIGLLLEAIYEQYGYDFRGYSQAHIRRRIRNRMLLSGMKDVAQLHDRVKRDKAFTALLLQDFSITVTEMFRDPEFYKVLREQVVPVLRTYPFIRIWHAGCSTGEEAYSMAILLTEEGLYDRTTIYATDFNEQALRKAREGVFPNEAMKEYTTNYQLAGGQESFAAYYSSHYGMAMMDQSLRKNIVWSNHNLATDSVFAEVQLVLCRNVLIYFDHDLQNRVQKLFFDSLVKGGTLCLGSRESLRFTDFSEAYSDIDKKNRVFKKKY